MLCCTLQTIENWSTILANIVTILGIGAIYGILKNRFSVKNIQLIVTNPYKNNFNLTIANLTDKDFSIIGIYLETKQKSYPAKEAVPTYSEIRHVYFPAHHSDDIYCKFSINPDELPKKLIFILKTTQGTLKFKIKRADTKPNREKATSDNK